jgi:hypothetical protein
MKQFQTLLVIAVSGVLLNCGLTASAQTGKPGYATVVRVEGEAKYSLDGGHTKYPLVAGKFLEAGSAIYTGESGVVDVVLGKSIDLPQAPSTPERISLAVDGPVRGLVGYQPTTEQNSIRLMANSTLVIDKLNTISSGADSVSDTELDLQQGSIYASVKKLSPAAQYLVKTPTGIAGVRGTEFVIALNKDGTIKDVAVYKTYHDDGLVLAVVSPSGATETYLIKDGEIWEPGNPSPRPESPKLRAFLADIFRSLRTHYHQLCNFDWDHTQYRCSTDFGF